MRKLNTFDRLPSDWFPTLVTARLIRTLDPIRPEVSAMLLAAGRILATGTAEECRYAAGRYGLGEPRQVDLGDVTVVPGFIDPHVHPLMHGQLRTWVDCGPDNAGSIPEVIELLRQRRAERPDAEVIRGYGYEHRNLAERRHPTRHELDRVAGDCEVYLMNASGHGGVVNSYTLAKYGITRETENPPGGEFFRDADGELTGELADAACNILTGPDGVKVGNHGPNLHLEDSREEQLEEMRIAQDSFLAGGVTTVADVQVTRRELGTYLDFAETGELTLRYSLYALSSQLDEILDLGIFGPLGNGRLNFAGIKLYVDGTLGGWTAWFPEGYGGGTSRTGMLYHEKEEYIDLVVRAHRAGLQTATHAQSPGSIGMVLEAVAESQRQSPREDARHRIEHCGLPDPGQITEMATLGIIPVSQTQHYYQWGEGVVDAIGTRGERFNPLGEFVAAGVPVVLSSDAPVADPLPLRAIQVAVDRQTARGNNFGDDSLRITAEQALVAHTFGGAWSLGLEDELGTLAPGKRADFAVLDGDPLTAATEYIATIPVMATWIAGEPCYVAEGAIG